MLGTDQQQATVLTHALLSALAGALPTMDHRRARDMGITAEQAHKISGLTTVDMLSLSMRASPFIRIQVNTDLLDAAIAEIHEEAGQRALVLDFVKQDASRDMMAELFDVDHRQHAHIRRSLGLSPNPGRPRECTPTESDDIFALWEKLDLARDPRTLLNIATSLSLPLRAVWAELAQCPGDYEPLDPVRSRPLDQQRITRAWEIRACSTSIAAIVEIAREVDLPVRTVRDVIAAERDRSDAFADERDRSKAFAA